MNKNVAVIIPLFNGAKWIEETINSVFDQDLKPVEFIIVDDNSTDNGCEIVSRYKRITLFKNEGKGSSLSRNLGTIISNSPFIAFLDQDDLWHPSHLYLLREALLEKPDANSAISYANSFEEGQPQYDLKSKGYSYFDPWTRFPFTIGVDGPSLALIKREVLFDIGLWEEKSTGMGDALLFLKLSSKKPLLRLNTCTVGKRVHAGSQWIAIRDWGAKYLHFRHQVMMSALEFRKIVAPDDPFISAFEDRLNALKSLQFLTEAISLKNEQEIANYASQLEIQLKNYSEEYIPHVFYCLMGALFPINDSEKLKVERDHVFAELLEIWPVDAQRTRKAIRNIIGEKPLVS